jgi:flagellar biosynthesis protein FliP
MKKKALSAMDWMVGYLVIDFVAVWVISRFSEQFGLGVAHWWVVLVLALVLDFVQGMGMMMVYPKK